MLPQSRRSLLAVFLAFVLSFLSLPNAISAPSKSAGCEKLLPGVSFGQEALSLLGTRIEIVANLNRRTVDEIRNLLLNNEAFHLDQCGRGFFAETVVLPQQSPLPSGVGAPVQIPLPSTPPAKVALTIDKDLTFKLHSKPDSKRTIYLDFNGERIENTQWNSSFNGGTSWNAVGFSIDSDFSTYTGVEVQVIQSVWQRVAEDFAAFDVDVTTEEPKSDRITRSDEKDDEYGTRVLISNDTVIFKNCKCSGLAYLGSFDLIGKSHKENQPAWVFTQGVGSNEKYIAESVTHEVGHTLGLSHDGSKNSSYYSGTNGWAPIMGVGFYQPITQWSNGSYSDSDNEEDDYKIMAKHGLVLRPDEDSNSISTARKIPDIGAYSGIIATPDDIDFFTFTPTTSEEFTFKVEPASVSPNLDLSLTIYPRNNPKERITSNPPNVIVTSDNAQGLSARISMTSKARVEYIIEIDGAPVLAGDSSQSDYGSLGIYRLTLVKGKDSDELIIYLSGNPSSLSNLANKLILPVDGSGSPQKLILPMDLEDGPPKLESRFRLYPR